MRESTIPADVDVLPFVRYHNAVMPIPVKNSFATLASELNAALGFTIEPIDCYKSKKQVIAELRNRIKNRNEERLSGDYDGSYVESLHPTSFEPPLVGNQPALRDPNGNELVYTIPNKPIVDPRLTGRIVKIGPRNIINPTLLQYLVNNAGLYGFVHYGPRDPSIWYWRGDLTPYTYTPQQTVGLFSNELEYLL